MGTNIKIYLLIFALIAFISLSSNNSYAQVGWCGGGPSTAGDASAAFADATSQVNTKTTELKNAIANAHCGSSGSCANNTQQVITDGYDWLRDEIQTYITDTFFTDLISPDLKQMAEQFSTTSMAQLGIIGGFFDAKAHIDGQRLINQLHAEAHNKYQPSRAFCRFGTNVRSLAASEQQALTNQLIMAERSIDRHLGNKMGIGSTGIAQDKEARFQNYQERYCNEADNNNKLRDICKTDDLGTPPELYNKDIDFTRTVDSKLTLDIDFTDASVSTDDEKDVLALSNYLYGHDVFTRPSPNLLAFDPDKYNKNHDRYLLSRSVIAKRNVAENSFLAIAAMKSNGNTSSAQYLKRIIQEMGVNSPAEIDEMIGEKPSYYAQMEVLTKKLYQNPNFYIGLIDKPENVKRQQAAMQSFELMQQRDLYESLIRSEMLLSVLLEVELQDYEKAVEAKLEGLTDEGPRQ